MIRSEGYKSYIHPCADWHSWLLRCIPMADCFSRHSGGAGRERSLLEEVQAGVPPHNGLWGARDLRPPCGMCGPTHRSRLLKNACRVCLHLCKIKDAQVTLDSVSQKRCRTEERAYESACWKVIEFHAVMHHLLESG